MEPDFATELLRWKAKCPPSFESWVFPSPVTNRPFHASEIQKGYLKPAGWKAGLVANGVKVNIGWHTFRHTYRSMLDATGAPIGVQQKLMRHAQVATTMDVYGNALMESKRQASRSYRWCSGTQVKPQSWKPSERGCMAQPLFMGLDQPHGPALSVGLCGVESP